VPKECSCPDAENIAQGSSVKSSDQKSDAVAVQNSISSLAVKDINLDRCDGA